MENANQENQVQSPARNISIVSAFSTPENLIVDEDYHAH